MTGQGMAEEPSFEVVGDALVEQDASETSLVDVSVSRLRILKALAERRATVSELAREMELNKSTVHGHMQDLVDDGFVQRHEDEDRLWVYYSLTERGKKLVDSERITLVIDITTLLSFLGAASLGLYRFLSPPEPAAPAGPSIQGGPDPASSEAGFPIFLAAYVALVLIALLGMGLHAYRRRSDPLAP